MIRSKSSIDHATLLAIAFASSLLVACSGDEPTSRTTHQAVIGQCNRNEAVLRGPASTCNVDLDCPCGSYCNTGAHECAFKCMVPPANQLESCATGSQCDDTGRCVAPGDQLPDWTGVLGATPSSVNAPSGGAAQPFQVTLAAYTSDGAADAQSTSVQVTGQHGTEVSCDATSYSTSCVLNGWTFAFTNGRYNAARTIWARNPAGSTGGEVQLDVEETNSRITVPVTAAAAAPARDGRYRGLATSPQLINGLAIDAVVSGSTILLLDPSRAIAPDGSLVLDLVTDSSTPVTSRSLTWLTPIGGSNSAAVFGEYRAAQTTISSTGAITTPLLITLPGPQVTTSTLQMSRVGTQTAECSSDTECGTGNVCPFSLHVCVPASVWSPAPQPVANLFEDPRSAQWWDAIDDLLGAGDTGSPGSTPAFATTGADLIETLMCTQDASDSNAGRLGVAQASFGTESRSGDLACVGGDGLSNYASGAVGLATRYDRRGDTAASAILTKCFEDLDRPVTSNFSLNFGANTGECVNLARFLPALRLLGTGELGKRTKTDKDPRTRSLFTRLVQQWSQLYGFIASTGLSEREYDDATSATQDQARTDMLKLLDELDAGWAALLDKRVSPLFATAAAIAPTGDPNDFNDYRLAKKPVAYWPFNSPNPTTDIIYGATLSPQGNVSAGCQIVSTRNSFAQGRNCSGYAATLPAYAPRLDGGNQSIVFHLANLHPEAGNDFSAYFGGTIVATETMSVIQAWGGDRPILAVVHPVAGGGSEWVAFDDQGDFGQLDSASTGTGMGSSAALVRDAVNMTYTLYIWKSPGNVQAFTQAYFHPVEGTLSGISPRGVVVGAAPTGPSVAPEQWIYGKSHAGAIDDIAIFKAAISKREFSRFAEARGYSDSQRAAWPIDMPAYGEQLPNATRRGEFGTQELTTPVGAALLEAQTAHLELVGRFVDQVQYQVRIACDDPGESGGLARTDLQSVIARVGRTMRQSLSIEALASSDQSARATAARKLLQSKRGQIARGLRKLTTCDDYYGMAEGEVPLYFASIEPNVDAKGAFFAPSSYLLGLAEGRVGNAEDAFLRVQSMWQQAQQSKIQQLMDDNSRAIRVDELKARYGEGLRALCGTSGQTTDQIMQRVMSNQFNVDTCFVNQTPSCITSNQGPIKNAEPTCYRGTIGASLMDMRSAYHSEQAAYQSWQTAIADAQAAEKMCVLTEMDLYGCSALDRHAVDGVTCPPNHQGTLALAAKYRQRIAAMQQTSTLFGTLVGTVESIASVAAIAAATGPGAAFLAAGIASMKTLEPQLDLALSDLKAQQEAVFAARDAAATVRECWAKAESITRNLAAAEEGWKTATAKLQTSAIIFDNALGQAREIVTEAPVVVDRELNRPALPLAFNYWLPDEIQNYRFAMDSARRYTYMALRATEYDTQRKFNETSGGTLLRSTVLAAWRPGTLHQQLQKMRALTDWHTTPTGDPAASHVTFDFGMKYFGLPKSSLDFGKTLDSYVRPVYSKQGEYLGKGISFSYLPRTQIEEPDRRCAERIWRVNVGTAGYPNANYNLKLYKRNVFASRRCDGPGFQVATRRQSTNLLVAAGEPQSLVPEQEFTVANLSVNRLDGPNALDDFERSDTAWNASSTELSLMGLYGDYVLVFPSSALDAVDNALDLKNLFDFNVRFDILSVDSSPDIQRRARIDDRIQIDSATTPIVVE
jgi:hypothetical protein